jgi:hypothetical protein
MAKDYNIACHPERSEGPWFPGAAEMQVPQARTRIPRSARDDTERKTETCGWHFARRLHSNCRFPIDMALTQEALMLLPLAQHEIYS